MLHLYPKNVYLGVGCRKNTPEEKIEEGLARIGHVLKQAGFQ